MEKNSSSWGISRATTVLTVLFTISATMANGMPNDFGSRAHSYSNVTRLPKSHHHHEHRHHSHLESNHEVQSLAVSELEVMADPDMSRSFEQIVKQNGFNFEEHLVTTSDGFILKVFRINSGSPKGKKAVYFQHGILDSADCWIMHKSEFAPAFQVARAGYDVWLGNTRGNKYSHDHQGSISNYDKWNFDFETMGEKDITAEIDYVRKVSGQSKVAYIGHSQGTTQMFYALATNEAFFKDRVSIFIALGPVAQLTHCKSSLIHLAADFQSLLVDTCSVLGIYEFFPANWATTGAMRLICGTIPQLCNLGLFLITDDDPSLNDPARTQVYLGHFPSGTSLRSINHYGQILNSKKFQRMDWGSSKNKNIYGQSTPPLIDLQNIKSVPIAMFVGTSDQLATTEDNRWAKSQLSTLKFYQEYKLGHMSFMVAKDMTYFQKDVMNLLHQYHPSNSVHEEPVFLA